MKDIGRRNAQIRRTHELEKQGLGVNYTLYEAEADLFQHMQRSEHAPYQRLRKQFLTFCDKYLDRPLQLATNYVGARVYKHCLIMLDLESLLGNTAIENEFYHFKETFNTKARKTETREEFYGLVRQIHTLQGKIMASSQTPDPLEAQGFSYSDSTFDDIFVKKFRDVLDISTESSEDEDEAVEPQPAPESDQIDSSQIMQPASNQIDSSGLSSFPSDSFTTIPQEEEPDINLDNIEAYKFNWFKYLIDKYLQHKDDDGNVSALHSADSYITLLNIVISAKTNEEIQDELLDLVGFHNFALLEQLMAKREDIKVYCTAQTDKLKEERGVTQTQYKGKNMPSGPQISIGV